MKKVSDIGEFDLIARIESILPKELPSDILIGPGDDTAVVLPDMDIVQLLTTDMQVENRHFKLEWIRPYSLGKRVISVNLSDIAAMGGNPAYALVSLCLPDHLTVEFFDQLIKGMRDQMSAHDAHIVGGNLSGGSDKLIVDITMIGTAQLGQTITRSSSKPGDRIFVTGSLGGGFGGFKVLEKFGLLYPDNFAPLVESYIKPIPRVSVGRELARSGIATSMIDLSDGLSGDLRHITDMSQVGAEIHLSKLPVHPALNNLAALTSSLPYEMALHGGDGYELLFTTSSDVSDDDIRELNARVDVKVTEIGRITDKENGLWLIGEEEERIALEGKGWDHFG
ncbi:MAG: thiamine-phosphate kinase [Calditrichaeota bacterium]|nr:thiamine-phosphate kinase [Calditrichota bacterium]MBT7616450.1 thiamine-phosphate kinase [Calditrichota bacterium]MBT7789407.1 thiamine-phosphate kinase [Calditrichota bacterium]